MVINTAADIEYLLGAIKRLGTTTADGKTSCPYGKLVHDDQVSNKLEALNGTLKAGKKQKKIAFDAELLLSPTHDAVEVVIL